MRQESLAKQLNVNQGTVSRWLSGTSAPKGLYLAQLKEIKPDLYEKLKEKYPEKYPEKQ